MRGNVLARWRRLTFSSRPAAPVFEGNLDGGTGTDTLILRDNFSNAGLDNFDVSQLIDFEMIRVGGENGWSLSNAAAFTGLTQVEPGGRLAALTPLTLGGDFAVDRKGTVGTRLSALTPGLTIAGDATFDGNARRRPRPPIWFRIPAIPIC